MTLASVQFYAFSQAPTFLAASALSPIPSCFPPAFKRLNFPISRRRAVLILASSFLQFPPHSYSAKSQVKEVPQEEEERVVRIFQEASPSVVYIKDLELQARAGKKDNRKLRNTSEEGEDDEDLWAAKVEGTGSGFVWDKAGHIVTNYHVVAKLATDTSGLHRCRVGFP